MNDNEAWKIARGLIEHEDGLINQRFTWLLVMNGFLFAAFGGGVELFPKIQGTLPPILLWLGLLTLALLGIASGLTAANLLTIAFDQVENVRNWWNQRHTEVPYPPLAGFQSRRYWLGIRPQALILLVIGAWGVLILLLVAMGIYYMVGGVPK